MKKPIRFLILALLMFTAGMSLQAQPYCDQAQGSPGFPSNPGCAASVCGYDPYCCNTNWDGICANEATTDAACATCLSTYVPVYCDQAQPTAGFPSDPGCQASVCGYDPYCCNTQWDGICANEATADAACANCLSTAQPPVYCDQAQPTAGFPSDPACQASVCGYDPYCCNTMWDGFCASEATSDAACVNCLLNPPPPPVYCDQAQPTAGFPSDPACEASVCGYDPYCCNTQWDGFCASEATADAACVNCLATPPAYCDQAQPTAGFPSDPACEASVCGYDPYCCNTMWDGFCASEATADAACVNCLLNPPPVGNDDCANATPIACGGSASGTTVGMTIDGPASSCGFGSDGADVWYTFTGLACTDVTATLCGSSFDTRLSVYTGSCGALTLVGCNDDFCGLQSGLTWTSTAGTTYFIKVSGYNGQTGNYVLNVACSNSAPANDDCSSVFPTTLVCGTPATFNGNTCNATMSAEETSVLGYATVWEAVTLTSTSDLTLSYCGTPAGNQNVVWIVTADCPLTALTNFATYDNTSCGDGNYTVYFTGLPAGTYYLPVLADPGFNTPGAYTLTALATNCTGLANDDCANAVALSCGSSVSGTTIGATVDGPASSCGGSDGGDVWYTVTSGACDQSITASMCGSSYDTKLVIYSGSCGALTEVSCNDDFCGLQSEITWTPAPFTTYYVKVSGFGGSTGNFVLNVNCVSGPPSNDDCSGATPTVCGGTYTGNTGCATSAGDGGCYGETSPDTWYTFTASGCQNSVTASLCGSSYDTEIGIYTGTCGALTSVGCVDDFCGLQSQITWTPTAGTTYYIRVGGFYGSNGSYTLNISCNNNVAANDNCSDVTPVTLTSGVPQVFTGGTDCGTASAEELSVLGAGAVWHAVTLTAACNNLDWSYCGTPAGNMGTAYIVTTDCPLTTYTPYFTYNFFECGDGNMTMHISNLPAGTYYLPVLADANYNTLGAYTLTVTSTDCPGAPANDNVCNAAPLSIGVNGPYDNTYATAEPGEAVPAGGFCQVQDGWCEGSVAHSLWFTLVAPASGHVTIQSPGFDTQLAMWDATVCSDLLNGLGTLIAANDDDPNYSANGGVLFSSFLDRQSYTSCLIPGHTYYVQLDGYFSTVGTTTIVVTDAGNLAPVISGMPADISINVDGGQCTGTATWTEPFASDPEGCAVSISSDWLNGAAFPIGTTTVTYTAVDPIGASSTATFNVTVTDNEAPVIADCPSNMSVCNDYGTCSAVVFWNAPTASDCGNVAWTSSHNPGDVFAYGTTTVTYTATDENNNSSSCSFDITVGVCDPSGPNATVSTNAASLDWTPAYGNADYEVKWDVGAGSFDPNTSGNLVTGANPPAAVTGLTLGQTYHWYVRSTCVLGSGNWSNWVDGGTFTTACPPDAPNWNLNFTVGTPTMGCPQFTVLLTATLVGAPGFPSPAPTYQWFKNNAPIAGATNPTYLTPGKGNFRVEAYSGICASIASGTDFVDFLPTVAPWPGQIPLCANPGYVACYVDLGSSSALTYQWQYDAPGGTVVWNAIAGSTNPTHNATSAGAYRCVMTFPGGCTRNSTNYVQVVNGNGQQCPNKVDEAQATDLSTLFGSCNLFPNPNNGKFVIEMSHGVPADVNVEIFDALGRTIMNTMMFEGENTKELDLSKEAAGMYMVRLNSDKIVQTFRVQVIK